MKKILKRGSQKGFSLIELMVALTIAGILLTVGIPGFSQFIKKTRITEQRDSLFSSLMLARTEAVNRGLSVSVCVSDNQKTCKAIGTGTMSWASGWIIFTDPDEDGHVDTDETVLKVQTPIEGGNVLLWDDGRIVTFDSEGWAYQFGTFTICDQSKESQLSRAVIVSNSGRVRRDTVSANGGGLVCS